MVEKVYDLNVWNESDLVRRDDTPRWRIDVYECYDDVDFEHHDNPAQIIFLNDVQAEMLTLGKSPDEGGDYDWDTDFWIDPAGFLDVYKNIPRKVTRYLEALV
jgi:hypothetical protein